MKNLGNFALASTAARRTLTRALALLLAALVLSPAAVAWALDTADPDEDDPGYPPGGPVSVPPTYSPPPAEGFEWFAPNRYNDWADNWSERGQYRGWNSESYNPAYVNPPSWSLYFQGCQAEADFRYDLDPANNPKPARKYRWKWNGQTKAFSEDCSTALDFPAQGNYFVELTVREGNGTEKTYVRPVQVKDILIVVLGDSSAAGEGAPDSPAGQYEGATSDWVDNRCHRSKYAGSAQAAEILEKSDPKSSVTFLSFACSGATLNTPSYDGNVLRGTGITGGFVGIEPPLDSSGNFADMLLSQTQQMWYAVGSGRKVDVLIAAGGINDVHFADLASDCLLLPFCQFAIVDLIDGLAYTVDGRFYHDLPNVVSGWNELGEQIAELEADGMEFGQKLALEYPPFFHDDDGSQCLQLFEDIIDLPLFEWLVDEIAWADAYWAPDLNLAVKGGATANGFEMVTGIVADFHNHGMCADDRWINTATDAAAKQGDADSEYSFFAELSSTGTAHPNAEGYAAYARRILDKVGSLVDNDPPVAVADKMWVSPPLWNFGKNLLENDYDPNPTDVLSARVATKPAHGTVEIDAYGYAFYKPNTGFFGTDSFVYGVSDGLNERFATVQVTVEQLTVTRTTVVVGTTTTIDDLLGGFVMEGPYTVVFDFEPPDTRGELFPIPGLDRIEFQAPEGPRRRSLRVPYTIYSGTTNITSPDYGRSKRGLLKIRIKRQLL